MSKLSEAGRARLDHDTRRWEEEGMARTIPINRLSIPIAGLNDAFTAAGFNMIFGKAANVTLFVAAQAFGLTHSLFYDDGSISIAVIPPSSGIGLESTLGKVKTNEDFVTQFAIPANTKLIWNIANGTAAAILLDALLQVE
jgi:hypothetical protein